MTHLSSIAASSLHKGIKAAEQILKWQSDDAILELYEKYKDNPKIKWKESIKKVVGIDISVVKGEDK